MPVFLFIVKPKIKFMDITRLKCWPDLQKLGFVVINFRAYGRIVNKGCALRQQHTDYKGETFYSDIICIEPHIMEHSKDHYHITGRIITPYMGTTYYYDNCNTKQERHDLKDRMNEFIKATEIMKYVELMLHKPATNPE